MKSSQLSVGWRSGCLAKALPSSWLKARLCLAYSETEKGIIFANNIKSRSFYSSFDIARRYAKHRVQDILYATRNGGFPSSSDVG